MTANVNRKITKSAEKIFDFFKELCSSGSKTEWSPMKQFNSDGFFELRDLPTDCGLLNAIGHFA